MQQSIFLYVIKLSYKVCKVAPEQINRLLEQRLLDRGDQSGDGHNAQCPIWQKTSTAYQHKQPKDLGTLESLSGASVCQSILESNCPNS